MHQQHQQRQPPTDTEKRRAAIIGHLEVLAKRGDKQAAAVLELARTAARKAGGKPRGGASSVPGAW